MNRDTALLLGAGFSYPAGIPVMAELAKGFPNGLQGAEKLTYENLKKLVPEIQDDFELLMECCHDVKEAPIYLINRMAKCCFGEEFSDFERLVEGARVLDRRLKEYLRQACKISKEKIEFLYPLMNCLKRSGYGVDIFSLNYDLVIETLCEEFFISYTDGFAVNWEPGLFTDECYQVRLYKLHGSFIWYQSDLGERVKIPIWEGRNEVDYLAQCEVVSMMVYPRRKKREPFEELLRIFRERLLTLDRLVVIGYSFRDEELKDMVMEGMRKNHRLHLELVSPSARELSGLFAGANLNKRITYFEGGVEDWIENRMMVVFE